MPNDTDAKDLNVGDRALLEVEVEATSDYDPILLVRPDGGSLSPSDLYVGSFYVASSQLKRKEQSESPNSGEQRDSFEWALDQLAGKRNAVKGAAIAVLGAASKLGAGSSEPFAKVGGDLHRIAEQMEAPLKRLARILQTFQENDEPEMTITINGAHAVVSAKPITYEEIVERAKQRGTPSVVYHGRTVIDGEKYEKNGILSPGESVMPVDGMRFTAVHTGNA